MKHNKEVQHITRLVMKDIICPVIIKSSGNEHPKVSYVGECKLDIEATSGVLSIVGVDVKKTRTFTLHNKQGSDSIVIELGNTVNTLDLEVLLGSVKLSSLNLDQANIEIAKGSFNAEGLQVKGRLQIEAGFGGIKLSQSELNDLNVEVGVGGIEIKRSSIDTLKTSTGVGKVLVSESQVTNRI